MAEQFKETEVTEFLFPIDELKLYPETTHKY